VNFSRHDRPSGLMDGIERIQTGVMRLGAPLRGIIYGLGALAMPVAWTWGYRLAAFGIAMLVLAGIATEASLHRRP